MRMAHLVGDRARLVPQGETRIERIALVSSGAFGLIHFRGPLIASLSAEGVTVFVLAPAFTDEEKAQVQALGGEPIAMTFRPASASPLVAFFEAVRLARQLQRLQPDVVMAFFIKASVVATLAALLAGVPGRFLAIEGLGYFLGPTRKATLQDRILAWLIKQALRRCVGISRGTFFLNTDDSQTLLAGKHAHKVMHLKGVGVDLAHYREAPFLRSPVSFVYVGRLLFAKGIADYVSAAASVLAVHPEVTFFVVGTSDGTARSVPHETVRRWQAEGTIVWLGQLADVRPVIARSAALVLPSYGEGASRSVQEAMAMGRPVITTSAPGCREMIEPGVNGLLVPPGDPKALARAMTTLIEEPEVAQRFGKAARQWAERHFNAKSIAESIKDHLKQRVEQP